MKTVRQDVDADARANKSRMICDQLLALDRINTAERLFVYVSFRSEVETHDLIGHLLGLGKIVTVPKIVNSPVMRAHRIARWEDLRPGTFGILEPVGVPAYQGPLDVCIAPGLAFSPQGDRLGYGKGHYDHFLASQPKVIAVGLAFDCQIVDHVPTEATDHAMDIVVTEQRVY